MIDSISLENLRRKVPSIFTESGSNKTSDKYQHISTAKIINGLLNEGFAPTWATQCRTRLTDKRAFTKHMLRFRHVNARPTASGLYPEIVLINSHDGLSSYRLMAGVFRLVCSNGLVAGNTYDEIRIRHQGDILGNVIEGTYHVIEDSKKMIESAEKMSALTLNNQEKEIFVEAAHSIRFENSPISEAIEPTKLLTPRRFAETNKNDLFTVFNIVQENLIKGGVRGYVRDANGYHKRIRTRAINSIDQNTILNRALWSLAEKMMQVKGE
jgi:hypothetical protein